MATYCEECKPGVGGLKHGEKCDGCGESKGSSSTQNSLKQL